MPDAPPNLPQPQSRARITLAIEASGPQASVAVARGEDLLHLEAVAASTRHADDLMPAVQRAFIRIQAAAAELSKVFVSVGPGGFTGLRIAVATAKMLGMALGCRVIAVPEADAVVEAAETGPLTICLAGKRDQFWTVLHTDRSPESGGQVLSTQTIVERTLALGIARIAVSQPLDRLPEFVSLARAAGVELFECHPDASHVWRAGRRLAAAGLVTAPEHLLPIYPREPEAVRLWRERQN